MNIEIKQFAELDSTEQWQVASAVSAETNRRFGAEQKIVPVTPISILQREIGVVALHKNTLLGYVGATNLNDQYTQIGTLVVPEHCQGSGIGATLVASITEQVAECDRRSFAFCNPNSVTSFEKSGYTPALPGELPPQAHSHFNNQPMIHVDSTEIRNAGELVGAGVLS